MNVAQKQKLLDVIDNDCQITGKFINEQGQTCAVGALLLAEGLEPDAIDHISTAEGCLIVAKAYDLLWHETYSIMSKNDNNPTPWTRRAAIRAFVDTLEVTE